MKKIKLWNGVESDLYPAPLGLERKIIAETPATRTFRIDWPCPKCRGPMIAISIASAAEGHHHVCSDCSYVATVPGEFFPKHETEYKAGVDCPDYPANIIKITFLESGEIDYDFHVIIDPPPRDDELAGKIFMFPRETKTRTLRGWYSFIKSNTANGRLTLWSPLPAQIQLGDVAIICDKSIYP